MPSTRGTRSGGSLISIRTDTTNRRPSTDTSATVRPWKPCTLAVGVPHIGHDTDSSRVRADRWITSTSSARSSTASAGSSENTVFARELTSRM